MDLVQTSLSNTTETTKTLRERFCLGCCFRTTLSRAFFSFQLCCNDKSTIAVLVGESIQKIREIVHQLALEVTEFLDLPLASENLSIKYTPLNGQSQGSARGKPFSNDLS